jgi:hypothetical protein
VRPTSKGHLGAGRFPGALAILDFAEVMRRTFALGFFSTDRQRIPTKNLIRFAFISL